MISFDIFCIGFCKLILGELDLLSEPRRTQTIYAYICIYFIIHIRSTHIISIDFCHVVSFGSFLEPEWTNLNWQWVLALRLSPKNLVLHWIRGKAMPMPPEKVPDEPPVLGAGILNGQTIKHFQGHLILQDCGVLMPEKKQSSVVTFQRFWRNISKTPWKKVIPWTWLFL